MLNLLYGVSEKCMRTSQCPEGMICVDAVNMLMDVLKQFGGSKFAESMHESYRIAAGIESSYCDYNTSKFYESMELVELKFLSEYEGIMKAVNQTGIDNGLNGLKFFGKFEKFDYKSAISKPRTTYIVGQNGGIGINF